MKDKLIKILAQYTSLTPDQISETTRFREDMELTSLDFMTLLGEVEDTFDIEFEEEDANKVFTVGDALDLIKEKQEEE